MKFGKVVRIGPKHVSMATPQAVKDIYGHGTPATKDDFYGAFASTHLNVSDAQDKTVHNTKRKRFAVAFAQKSVTELEYVAQEHLQRLVRILDAKATAPLKSSELPDPKEMVDMKSMMVYLMYDIMCVMLFSQDPQFLDRQTTMTTAETVGGRLYEADVHKALKGSLAIAAALGWIPQWRKTVNFLTQGWHKMWDAGDQLRDVTIHLLRNRIKMENERLAAGGKPIPDMFSTLLWTRDREPLGLEFGELVTEASNLFNAAGENNEIALTNIIWLIARTPRAAAKLREELDQAFENSDSSVVPAYDTIKDLPYLRACIDEGLRLRPSLPGGLPRVTPASGMSVGGHWLEGGTTVSVSTYTVHRDPEIFPDPYAYNPDRWLEAGAGEMQKVFLPFSQGGRACLGRNIAYFEMSLVIATLFRRYEFALPKPGWDLEVAETMSAHTGPLPTKVWRRNLRETSSNSIGEL
jgi:benzoate 4-monooxygenase